MIHTGTHFLADNDFTTQFRKTGQVELDRLIEVYNRMASGLRSERINALEAIGARGTITLHVEQDHLLIEDSGSGLSAEARAHLFTPFSAPRRAASASA